MSAHKAVLRPARPPRGQKKHLGRPGVFLDGAGPMSRGCRRGIE
jgi:hypothetical protein